VPIAALLFWLYDATVHTTAAAVCVALALLPLGSIVRSLGDILLGMSAVKLVRINGLYAGYYTVVLFFSGQFAPIEVLPGWMQTIAHVLPFYWVLGFPTELLVGRAQLADAPLALAVLLGWFVVLFWALRLAWPRAMRASETVGG
jgi:ABC-2 type transport system permease protein